MADDGLPEVLAEFARTMVTDFPIQAILDRLVERIVDVLPVNGAGVTLISPETSPVYLAASDAASLRFEALQRTLGDGPCLHAYRTGEPVCVADVRDETRFGDFLPSAARLGLGAVFAFPLRHGDDPLGALDLYCEQPTELSPSTMHAARTLADVAAAYILNARARADLVADADRARAQIWRDELTGLANRSQLLEDLGRAVRQFGRPGHSVTVLFVDLDRFKEVNDRHGHRTGDELLVAVAARLSALVRPGDTVARLSGDEFVIVYSDLEGISQAEAIGRRVTSSFCQSFPLSGVVVESTASVGGLYASTGTYAPGDLLHAADMAMYEAKRLGGARCHLVTSGLVLPDDVQQHPGLVLDRAIGEAAGFGGGTARSPGTRRSHRRSAPPHLTALPPLPHPVHLADPLGRPASMRLPRLKTVSNPMPSPPRTVPPSPRSIGSR